MTLVKSKVGSVKNVDILPTTKFFDELVNFEFPTVNFWEAGSPMRNQTPVANVIEDESKYYVEISVPGFSREEIHLELKNNNILVMRAEKKNNNEWDTKMYTKREFYHYKYARSFTMPESINVDKISATCNNGILTIELPKHEPAKTNKVKKIEIKS